MKCNVAISRAISASCVCIVPIIASRLSKIADALGSVSCLDIASCCDLVASIVIDFAGDMP